MVVAIIGVLGALTIPALLRAKIAANESAVLGSLRAVNSAQTAYASSASTGGFASSFSVLIQPCPSTSQGFISPDLAGDPAQKSGYSVALGPGSFGPAPADCNGVATSAGYYLTAVPLAIGRTGQSRVRFDYSGGHLLRWLGLGPDASADGARGRRDAGAINGPRPDSCGRADRALKGGKLISCAIRGVLRWSSSSSCWPSLGFLRPLPWQTTATRESARPRPQRSLQ